MAALVLCIFAIANLLGEPLNRSLQGISPSHGSRLAIREDFFTSYVLCASFLSRMRWASLIFNCAARGSLRARTRTGELTVHAVVLHFEILVGAWTGIAEQLARHGHRAV